jgi:hypothetical protein
MNADTLLDQLNGRLTVVVVEYPATKPFIWSFQKHIQYALKHPGKANIGKLLRKGKRWLSEMMWKHPMFRPEFMGMVELIDKFNESRTSAR